MVDFFRKSPSTGSSPLPVPLNLQFWWKYFFFFLYSLFWYCLQQLLVLKDS